MSRLVPIPVPGGDVAISMGRVVLGGISMVFGGRMAGGCTSGDGISGLSTLSMSSVAIVALIFTCGMGLATFIR